jgi:hypothetical protein
MNTSMQFSILRSKKGTLFLGVFVVYFSGLMLIFFWAISTAMFNSYSNHTGKKYSTKGCFSETMFLVFCGGCVDGKT